MLSAEIEADYIWGLTQPSYLVGDVRYYLTTFSSAINQLKNIHKIAVPAASSTCVSTVVTMYCVIVHC